MWNADCGIESKNLCPPLDKHPMLRKAYDTFETKGGGRNYLESSEKLL
jgi:hypothetical protein